jgi:hypothetical protein
MKQLFKDILTSFYSAPFYADLAHMRQGIGMKFILVLTVIETILMSALLYTPIHMAIEQIPSIARTLPYMTLKNGKLSIDKPSPYYVHLKDNGPVVAIVDTNYKITDVSALSSYMKQNGVFFMLTEDKMVFLKDNKHELEIRDLKDQPSFIISHGDWDKAAEKISQNGMAIVMLGIIVFLLISLLVGYLIITFFVAIVVALLSLLFRAGLDFTADMRIAAVTRIPVSVIIALPLLVGKSEMHGWACWLLSLVYLVFAVMASKSKSTIAVE